MREKALISFLVAAAVALLCFLGLLFYLSNVEIETTMPEEEVIDMKPLTEAVIYEDGRMWIRENRILEDNAVDLPEGIEPGSLRIEYPEISGIRMIPPEEKDLMYTIETEDGTYNGKYLGESGGFIAIEEDGKTVAINKDKVKSYSYTPQPENINALELFYNGSMPTNITLSYIVDGAEFGIRYTMEGEQIEAMADIKSPVSLKNAKLTLRTGTPFGGALYKEASRSAAIPMAPMPLSAAREFEFYSFVIENVTMDSPLSLELFDGTIKAESYYYWSDSAVERRVRINNTLKNPLPSGVIYYYDNSTWVGTTHMPYTAEGEESTIAVGYSQDIKVEKNLTDMQIDKEKKIYEYTISVKNPGSSVSNITIEQTLSKDATIVSTNPKAEVMGNRIKWETMLKPKETKTFVYKYRIIPLP